MIQSIASSLVEIIFCRKSLKESSHDKIECFGCYYDKTKTVISVDNIIITLDSYDGVNHL